MRKCKLHLGYAGYCLASEHHAVRGGRRRQIRFHALWGLIDHPEHGLILYDSGYTRRFFTATQHWPARIYAKTTRVVIDEKEEVKQQLLRHGIDPTDIRHLILTHFHADHTGGLRDFPNATIYTSALARSQVQSLGKRWAFTKGILPELHPPDLLQRIVPVGEQAKLRKDPHFGPVYDLFGDDSLHLIPLPGHAVGQLGVRLQTPRAKYLLAADAAWLRPNYQDYRLPHPVVRLFFDSWRAYKSSLRKLYDYHQRHPEVIIVPTHCQETTDPLVSETINFHL